MTSRFAVIDIGTVSVRLAIARQEEQLTHPFTIEKKLTRICHLGEGVDASGFLSEAAQKRVLSCVEEYLDEARRAGATKLACVLTSAARDAQNAAAFLEKFHLLGIEPQIISGEIEARLSFYGAARNFVGRELLIADNGGGSTELGWGSLQQEGLSIYAACSLDIGCRRFSERFHLDRGPISSLDCAPAYEAAQKLFQEGRSQLEQCAAELFHIDAQDLMKQQKPEVLLLMGGTATSLVAMLKQLEPYDAAQVHLARLSRADLLDLETRISACTLEERAQLKGLQAQRASVILGGTIIISELMDCFEMSECIVSEDDLLTGLCAMIDKRDRCTQKAQELFSPAWEPLLSEL